jgi:hypothetical protein
MICDGNITSSARLFGAGHVFPLYLYPESNGQQKLDGDDNRIPNLNPEIVKQIAEGLGKTFTNEKEETPNTFAPIDILDYIYACCIRHLEYGFKDRLSSCSSSAGSSRIHPVG